MCKKIIINIHRNHAFEPIESIIAPFLYFSGLSAKFNLSNYDDSLNFENISPCDLEIIYLDLSRYKSDFLDYLQSRLAYLRNISKAPILVILMDLQTTYNVSNFTCDIAEILHISQLLDLESTHILDEAKLSITGTKLSNIACLKLAQILGLYIIPSFVLPSLKAIVLDLDNTLYSGILGEDGIKNLILTKEHKDLQEKMLAYKHKGFLLAIASKNDKQDVLDLFSQRTDFPLKLSDFDCVMVDWNLKSENLKIIAKNFNIGLDSMLFIDDNPAEIEHIKPLGVKYILATSPSEVLRILNLFPQMRKTTQNREDSLRSNDIAANVKRKELENLPQEAYFSNLAIQLEFSINDIENYARITELLNKTNQFISNYTRPTQEQVKLWLDSKEYVIISIAMQDRFSDSGNIAIIIGRKVGEQVEIIDIAVSCRALGRRLENIMLQKSFSLICEELKSHSNSIRILYKKGERNTPFLDTLSRISNSDNLELGNFVDISLQNINTNGLNIVVVKDTKC